VALLSVRDVGNGIAGISIDGGPEHRVDYYSSIRVGEQLNYLSPVLSTGAHTLKVRSPATRTRPRAAPSSASTASRCTNPRANELG
jgi:hypothetical protein